MTSISVSNVYSRIRTKDKKILTLLYNRFTKIRISSHVLRPKVIRLVSKAGRFPTGLLDEVILELKGKNVEFLREDLRENSGKIVDIKFSLDEVYKTSKSIPIQLYSYQKEAVQIALLEQRGIIKCATGGGKTLMIAAILKGLNSKNYRKLILTRSKSLVTQTRDVLKSNGFDDVGCVTGDVCEISNINIIICTIQSIHKLQDILHEIKVVIVDEVHQFTSKKSVEAFKKLGNAVMRLGFSATPWKSEDEIHDYTLKSWIGPELCDITTQFLKNEKTISECVCVFHEFYCEGISNLPFQEAEDLGIVNNQHFHKKVSELVNEITEGRILILVSKLAHGTSLQAIIPNSYWIKGADSLEEREKIFNLLIQSQNKKEVVISSSIIYTGINVAVHYIINATGGKSETLVIQKIGRGLRLAKDKTLLEYHDFHFRGNKYLQRHSFSRMKTLEEEGHQIYLSGKRWKNTAQALE